MAKKRAVAKPKGNKAKVPSAGDAQSGGSAGYRGYDYQILATVWLALELMTSGKADAIVVEPPSEEDVDLNLNVPDEKADSGVGLKHMSIQIKLRNGTHWTGAKLRTLLDPKAMKKRKPRVRPLQMLINDPMLHYVLLTNVAVESSLSGAAIGNIDDLPRDWRCMWMSPPDPSVCRRIGILADMSPKLLRSEIRNLLLCRCSVPESRLSACCEELLGDIRRRLLSPAIGVYSGISLLNRVREFGGSLEAAREPVRPDNYAAICEQLQSMHALILVGEPGSGKTTLAEALVANLERTVPPHERFVVKSSGDLSEVRQRLEGQGNHVIYFDDPWGKYAVSADAAAMAGAILDCVSKARPGKKVVVTSCTHVFQLAFGSDGDGVASYVLGLEGKDYSQESYRSIFLRQGDGWSARSQQVAREWMDDVLAHTATPLAVRAACMVLAARLRKGTPVTKREVTDLARASSVGNAAQVIHSVLASAEPGGVAAGVAVWAALSGTEAKAVSDDCARRLRDAMTAGGAAPPPLERVMQLLADAGRLQRVVSGYTAHSSDVEALARLAEKHPDTWRDTLGCIFRGWVCRGECRAVLRCMKTDQRAMNLVPKDSEGEFRRFLFEQVIESDDYSSGLALDDMARFLRRDSPEVVLVRSIMRREAEPETHDWTYHLRGGPKWACESIPDEDVRAVSGNQNCVRIGRKFVLEYLPQNTQRLAAEHVYEPALLVGFLRQFDWPLKDWFVKAFEESLRDPIDGCSFLAECLCEMDSELFNTVLEQVLAELQSASTVSPEEERYARKEAQGEVDERPDWSDNGNDYAEALHSAIEALVRWKRKQDGFAWIAAHSWASELLSAWASCLKYHHVDLGEEQAAFIETCERCGKMVVAIQVMWQQRDSVWNAALARHVLSQSVSPDYMLADTLRSFAADHDFQVELTAQARALSFARRALAAFSFAENSDSLEGGDPCGIFAIIVNRDEWRVVRACRAAAYDETGGDRREPVDTEKVLLLVEEWPDLPAVYAWELAFSVVPSVYAKYIERFLASPDPTVRAGAWRCCRDRMRVMEQGLADPDYRCRRAVLVSLAPSATPDERVRLLSLEKDVSAFVRQALAKAIGQQRWVEGVDALIRLLRDKRDYAPQCDEGYALAYNVAREACFSLRNIPLLSDNTLGEILAFLGQCTDAGQDADVHGLLFRILAEYPSEATVRFCSDYVGKTWWDSKWPKSGGADILVQCLHAVIEMLEKSPALAQFVDMAEMAQFARMDVDWLSYPALGVLGVSDETLTPHGEGSEKDECFGEDPTRLLFLCSASLQRDRPQWIMQHVPTDDPCLELVDWACEQPRSQAYSAFCTTNPKVPGWLQSLAKGSRPMRYTRWAAKRLIGQEEGNDPTELPHPFHWPKM